jgi:hypothetical protein
MIEISLTQVAFGVQPTDAGKQLNFVHEQSGTVYMVPFTDEAVDTLVEQLQTSNEDLQKQHEERLRKAQVEAGGLEIAQALPDALKG